MMTNLLWLALLQDDFAKLQERADKLEKISSADVYLDEAAALITDLEKFILANPKGKKLPHAHELLAIAHRGMGARHVSAGDMDKADAAFLKSAATCRDLYTRTKEAYTAEQDEERKAELEKQLLFSGFQYVFSVHQRVAALKGDAARLSDLESTVKKLEEFFREYFNDFDTYILSLEGATCLGRCYQYLAEAVGEKHFSVADAYYQKSIQWVGKARDQLVGMRDMREEQDMYEAALNSAVAEMRSRVSYSRLLKKLDGPWERPLGRGVDNAELLFATVPSLRKTSSGQKLQAEIVAAKKMLQE